MAVPKRKKSRAKRDSRRAHWKINLPSLSECPQCHEPKIAHQICPNCGFYKDEFVVEMEAKREKKRKKREKKEKEEKGE